MSIDEIVQRYTIALDEVRNCANQLNKLSLKQGDDYESLRVIAKDWLQKLTESIEGTLEDVQLILDDMEA